MDNVIDAKVPGRIQFATPRPEPESRDTYSIVFSEFVFCVLASLEYTIQMSHWFAGYLLHHMVIRTNCFLPKSAAILTLKLYFVSRSFPDKEVLIHEIYKNHILCYETSKRYTMNTKRIYRHSHKQKTKN